MDHSLVRCRLRGRGGARRSLCSMDHSLVRCRLRGGLVGLSVAWITAWLDAGGGGGVG